jgi:DNA-directed RNA polymerase specialized sigma24 family protein
MDHEVPEKRRKNPIVQYHILISNYIVLTKIGLESRPGLMKLAFMQTHPAFSVALYQNVLLKLRPFSPRFAEDALHDVLLALLKKGQIAHSVRNLEAWLLVVGKRRAINLARAQSSRERRECAGSAEIVPVGRAEKHDVGVDINEIKNYINQSRSQVHRVAYRRHALGWSIAEIAATEGISIGTVENRLKTFFEKACTEFCLQDATPAHSSRRR